MMSIDLPTRRKRPFKRSRPRPIRPTQDDIAICNNLYHYHYLTFSMLRQVCPHRAEAKLRERVRALYDNRYVDRPRAQIDFHVPGKRPELIYALGDQGARLLAETHGYQIPKSSFTDKNRSVGRPHLQHTLSVAAIRFAADRLPTLVSDVETITAEAIINNAPEATRRDPNPWTWHVTSFNGSAGHRNIATVPDHFFGLDFANLRQRFYFICEADRNTMPVVRSTQRRTSIIRKFEAYLAGYKAGYHAKRYGIGNIRFLFMTTSQKRIDTMLNALRDLASGEDTSMFLFADQQQLREAPHLLAVPWKNAAGIEVTLID